MPLAPRTIKNNPSKFVRKIAIHSPSGGGKTRLAATAQDVPQMSDLYHLDLDAGTATLQSRGDIIGEEARRAIDVERVLWSFLNKEPDTVRFKTLVVDGLSALLKKEFEEMLQAKGGEATFKEYGKVATLGIRIIHLLRDLPISAIINTWSRTVVPNKEGTAQRDAAADPSVIQPDIPNGAMNSFLGSCDDVFYLMASDDKTRYLYTDKTKLGSMTVIAKMRDEAFAPEFSTETGGKVFPIIKNPTFTDLFARYQRVLSPTKK